jgi:hypothetical protein
MEVNVYKVELMVIDFDGVGEEGVKRLIEEARYPNHAIAPKVKKIVIRKVEWTDDHPLNKKLTSDGAYEDLFRSNSE